MKELGPVRFRDFGDRKQAEAMHSFGRKLLGEMKQEMNAFGVKFLRRQIQLNSGIIFIVSSNMIGLAPIDEIQTFVPQQNVIETSEGKRDRIVGFMVTFNVNVRAKMYVYEPDAEIDPLMINQGSEVVTLGTAEFDNFSGYDADGAHTDNTYDVAPTVAYYMTADWEDSSYIEWTYKDPNETQDDLDQAEALYTFDRQVYSSYILNYRKRESDLFGFGTVAKFNSGVMEYQERPGGIDGQFVGVVGTAILPPVNNMKFRHSEGGKEGHGDTASSYVLPQGSTFTAYYSKSNNYHDWTMPKLDLKEGDYHFDMSRGPAFNGDDLSSTMDVTLYGEELTYTHSFDFEMPGAYATKKIFDITIGEFFEDGNFMSMIKKDENL